MIDQDAAFPQMDFSGIEQKKQGLSSLAPFPKKDRAFTVGYDGIAFVQFVR